MGGSSFERPAASRAFAPFAGATVLAWAIVPVGTAIAWPQYWAATGVAGIAGVLIHLATTRRLRLGLVPGGLLFLAAVGLVRNAGGGITSGAAVLAIMPVFYTALHSRSQRDLAGMLAGLALFYAVPILVVGGHAYPVSQYRGGLLALAVSGIIGRATQRLVGHTRRQAEDAQARERMLEQVNHAVHALFDSPDARAEVCAAARRISDATVALLYEPAGEELVCTAMSGLEVGGRRIVAAPASAAYAAFARATPRLVDADVPARVGAELWQAAGRPTVVLAQPLRRAGATLGVLVVGWPEQIRADGPRGTVVALLAHEAAAVIERADALDTLAGEAHTDPLTGLPNRRAWDAALARALHSGGPLTVAMIDLDHFKQFNDAYGHPAGDRLLKATGAAWRDQLRGGDLLARLGGEEFGLLLTDCDPATAVEVVARLRGRVPEGRTCSAGLAVRLGEETVEHLVARADAALYEAKARGRDRTTVSPAGVVAAPSPST